MKHIIIIGGGITGLAAAYYLKKNNCKVTLLEKGNRVGGWIVSRKVGNYLIEEGPRSFRSQGNGKCTLELIQELQLPCQEVTAKKRYLYINGQLQQLNLKFFLQQKGLSTLLKETSYKPTEDESIASFFTKRFNKHFTETFIDPLVKGIFGGDPSQLSLQSCFPKIWTYAQHRSLTLSFLKQKKEKKALLSLRDGMESLITALKNTLEPEIHLNQQVKRIILNNKVQVVTDFGKIEGDHIIGALPSYAMADLLPEASYLKEIPFLSMTTVHIGFQKPLLPHHGFGYLIPAKENEKILGMIWDSNIQGKSAHTQLSIMIQGEMGAEAIPLAIHALHDHLQIRETPDFIDITTAKRAIPQYPVGHQRLLERFNHPQITLVGNSYHGVGINDCIASAKNCIEKL